MPPELQAVRPLDVPANAAGAEARAGSPSSASHADISRIVERHFEQRLESAARSFRQLVLVRSRAEACQHGLGLTTRSRVRFFTVDWSERLCEAAGWEHARDELVSRLVMLGYHYNTPTMLAMAGVFSARNVAAGTVIEPDALGLGIASRVLLDYLPSATPHQFGYDAQGLSAGLRELGYAAPAVSTLTDCANGPNAGARAQRWYLAEGVVTRTCA